MRKHVENEKAKEVTTEPENEVQQDATTSGPEQTASDTDADGQKNPPEPARPVDLEAGPYEYKAGPQGPAEPQAGPPEPPEPPGPQAEPVNVADLQPGRDVDPLLGEKADVLQFLAQLTHAIEGAGIINGKYVFNLFKGFEQRLAALEAAVKQNSKQTRALSAKIADFILLKRLTKEEQEG